jgi:LAGLIDADG-like domain
MGYRSTRELTVAEAAYVAGLVDGEGTVTLSRRHANEHRQLVVTIANTERPLLEFVLAVAGTGKITRKRTCAAQHTPSYCYAVSNRQALSLLRQLHPYLISYKRARAELAIRCYVLLTPRNGRYTPDQECLRLEFERSFLAIRAHPRCALIRGIGSPET